MRFVSSLALLAVLAAASPAHAATLVADPDHSSASFTVSHFVVSKVNGAVPIRSATITTGANDVPTEASATLDATGIDTHNGQRDGNVKSWFEVTQYPTWTFKSTKVTPGPNNTFTMVGDLTMHGVTKPVTLTGSVNGSTPTRNGRVVGYSATGKIDRRDWNISSVPAAVGSDITLDLEIEAAAK